MTNPSVLLVHPNSAVRSLLGARLSAAGFVPILATDGRSALGAARRYHPSLALIDMTLPRDCTRELAHTLADSNDLPVNVCIIGDSIDRNLVANPRKMMCLTRGQVFHPAFSTHLMKRLETKANETEVGAMKIDAMPQLAKLEAILQIGVDFWKCNEALAILERWKNDEMLSPETRQTCRILLKRFGRGAIPLAAG